MALMIAALPSFSRISGLIRLIYLLFGSAGPSLALVIPAPLPGCMSVHHHPQSTIQSLATTIVFAKSNPDEDEDEENIGMDEAFRQLDALESLGSRTEGKESTVQKLDDQAKAELEQTKAASLEQEVELFKGLLQDSEQDQSTLYSDVMKDMGGTPKQMPSPDDKPQPTVIVQEETGTSSSSSSSTSTSNTNTIPPSEEDTQKFMDQAIQEALEEARAMAAKDGLANGDDASKKLSDSILDDEEIMKEIEEIFEKGNEKLLESLEEIRQEQQELARISAEQRSKVTMDNMSDDTKERLAAAEASMERQLGRVSKEKAEVERAVADLQRAKDVLDADPLLKMSSGNIIKPAALAGVLLFTVRSALDLLAMSGGGIEAQGHLTAALIQGAIALACAAYLLFS